MVVFNFIVNHFRDDGGSIMRRHDQVFVFLDFITYLKKVKNLIDLFKYFLVGGKQGIVCIDLG